MANTSDSPVHKHYENRVTLREQNLSYKWCKSYEPKVCVFKKTQIRAIIECHDVELGKLVRATYVECLGPLDQEVTTMDLLKRIELRMEFLTQHLERLPQEKVKIAQRVRCPLLELIIHMSTAKIGFWSSQLSMM